MPEKTYQQKRVADTYFIVKEKPNFLYYSFKLLISNISLPGSDFEPAGDLRL